MPTLRPLLVLLLVLVCLDGGHPPLLAKTGDQEPSTNEITDDLDRSSLITALERSLSYLRTLPPATRYHFGATTVRVQQLHDSLAHLRHLLLTEGDDTTLRQRITEDFVFLSAVPSQAAQPSALITGYYQPIFAGSLQRQPPYLYPLYSPPGDLVVRPQPGNSAQIGRLLGNTLTPYWTRREIEGGNLLRGNELVWLRDPFDAFTLHVQGSGIIRLPGGDQRGVHFAQRNGHPYTSLGTYLVKSGRMQLADVTMDAIRAYLENHPQERQSILWQNDSFIFFDWSPPGPAIGNLNLELTPGRSVAADQRIYPPGSLLYVQSRRPVMANGQVVEWRELRRLLTVQGTGSAIKGPGRLDIFWGTGAEAGMEAGQMKEAGSVVLLLLRENRSSEP